jgi:hypothetical protein
MRASAAALACVLVAVLSGPAAAATPVQRTRVVTTTRLVTLFHGLEYDLVDAVRAGQTERLDKLLASEFEQREGRSAGRPVPREAWLQGTSVRTPGAVRITDLAVHDRGELAIASFVMDLEGPGQSQFVVDVWRQRAPGVYELVTRYASELRQAPPGAAPVGVKPPDGKG